jgi:hypothetical protein
MGSRAIQSTLTLLLLIRAWRQDKNYLPHIATASVGRELF